MKLTESTVNFFIASERKYNELKNYNSVCFYIITGERTFSDSNKNKVSKLT